MIKVAILIVAMFLVAQMSMAEAKIYYRYVNESGNKVMVDQLPPEAVPKGYDLITTDGTLIKRVPRQLSAAELQDQSSEAAQERMRKEEQERLKAWDKSLMLRYSSIEDIEAARERAVQSIQIRVSILKSNRASVKLEIEREQARAADIERQNREVPTALSEKISVLHDEIQDIEDSIEARGVEIEELKSRFQRDIERFATLQERVKLRSQARPQPSERTYY